jgi:hypothetical protein
MSFAVALLIGAGISLIADGFAELLRVALERLRRAIEISAGRGAPHRRF